MYRSSSRLLGIREDEPDSLHHWRRLLNLPSSFTLATVELRLGLLDGLARLANNFTLLRLQLLIFLQATR